MPRRLIAGTRTDLSTQAEKAERLEEVVRDRTVKLKAARDQAEVNSAAAIKFLSTASHNIRQPLQASALLLGSLADEIVTERGRPRSKRWRTPSRPALSCLIRFLSSVVWTRARCGLCSWQSTLVIWHCGSASPSRRRWAPRESRCGSCQAASRCGATHSCSAASCATCSQTSCSIRHVGQSSLDFAAAGYVIRRKPAGDSDSFQPVILTEASQ